jgi:hypothetical protein
LSTTAKLPRPSARVETVSRLEAEPTTTFFSSTCTQNSSAFSEQDADTARRRDGPMRVVARVVGFGGEAWGLCLVKSAPKRFVIAALNASDP